MCGSLHNYRAVPLFWVVLLPHGRSPLASSDFQRHKYWSHKVQSWNNRFDLYLEILNCKRCVLCVAPCTTTQLCPTFQLSYCRMGAALSQVVFCSVTSVGHTLYNLEKTAGTCTLKFSTVIDLYYVWLLAQLQSCTPLFCYRGPPWAKPPHQ